MHPLDANARPVGRTEERHAFERLIGAAADGGSGSLVSVIGEPGIGKTTLVRSFAEMATTAGLTSIERACWPGQGAPPLWVWDEVFHELGIAPVDGNRPQLERFGAMTAALQDAGRSNPTLITIEDLHLADIDTMLFVRFLARSVQRLPVVVVVSWRSSGATITDHLTSIARESTHRFELGALTEPQVADVLDGYPALDPAGRANVIEACGGNPFFVHELAQQMSRGDDRLPHSVRQIIEDRLATVEPDARRVILAAAVLGSRSFVGEVALVSATPNAEVADLGPRSRGLIHVDDMKVVFQHQIVRDVLVATSPSSELIRLHRRATEMLTPPQSTAEACRRAEHAAAAGVDSVDAAVTAVRACRDAAERSRRDGGLHRAADLLALAVAARDAHPQLSREPELLVEHAEAVLATGRLTDARGLFDRAVDAADAAGNIVALARAAVGLGGVWVEEARDAAARDRLLGLLRRSIRELPESENVLHARLAIRLAAELRYQGESSVDDVHAALQRLRPLDDDRALAEGLSVYHHVLLTPPYARDRVAIARELIDVATRSGDELHAVVGRCWLAVDLYLLGDARADRAHEDFRAHASVLGCHSMDYIVAVLDAMVALRDGDLETAATRAAAAFELGTEVGDADAFGYYGGQLMTLHWMRGNVGDIREMIDELATSATLRTHDVVFLATAAAAAAIDGDNETADRWLQGTRIGSAATLPLFSTWSTAMMALTETASITGNAELAEDLLPLLEPYIEQPVRASLAITCVGPMRRLTGLLHVTAGRVDHGIAMLREAISDCRRLRNRPVEAILHAELATALLTRGNTGDTEEAQHLLEHACDEAVALGLHGRVDAWQELRSTATEHANSATQVTESSAGVCEWVSPHWRLAVDGRELRVNDSVGMQHLATLLASPLRDFSATELSIAAGGTVEEWSGDPTIDETARRAYATRLREIDADLARAEADADLGWVERLHAEHDALVEHIAQATGLGGRPRTMSSSRERARSRVSKALRRVIRHIGESDAVLGRELERTVQTGHTCRHDPDPVHPRVWTVHRPSDR